MRIIAGTARGRRLFTPKGLHTRPTADRVKEALFSVIAARVPGARVLDAFAGSGALGLEALSRGAAEAIFCESDRQALLALRRNIELCGFSKATVKQGDTLKLLPFLPGQFDLVFADPPYNCGLLPQTLDLLVKHNLLAPNALLIAETGSKNSELEQLTNWQVIKTGFYGDTALYYCQIKI